LRLISCDVLHFYSAQGPGVEISVVERILTAASDIEDLGVSDILLFRKQA